MKKGSLTIALAFAAACSLAQENTLSFVPDYRFTGGLDNKWIQRGDAQWKAQNGEIKATLPAGASGGILLLDRQYQDVALHSVFRAAAGSEAGFLFRLEQKADGLHGILISINNDQTAHYAVVIDAAGHLTQKKLLRVTGSIIRLAPPPDTSQAGRNNNRGGGQRNQGPTLNPPPPLERPSTAIKPGDWNLVEVLLDADIIRSFYNDGRESGAATDDQSTGYGPVALYAGGTGTVSFKQLYLKDVGMRTMPKEKVSDHFTMQRINDMYYSWGAGAGDFNKDGVMDIVSGPYIYFGPDYTQYREIFTGAPLNPSKDFTPVNCQYVADFNNDGWPDILSGPPVGTVYINPGKASRRWDKYEVVPSIQTEITVFRDIDGDGKAELVFGSGGALCYAKPDPAGVDKPWKVQPVSAKGYSLAHGIGVGDINGDGRMDIVNPNGWWEQPAQLTDVLWTYHPQAFARYGHRSTGVGGAVMAVYDVNGDGLNDVVTSLNAHGFGLGWFEQQKGTDGQRAFELHIIMDDHAANNKYNVSFSQIHGTSFADIDGDGVPDFIAGKRYFSHLDNYFDPDPYGAPVLYWFRTVRNPKAPGGAEFVPELIHNRSGAGSDVLVTDLNKDGAIDIVAPTDRGTFIFWNLMLKRAKR